MNPGHFAVGAAEGFLPGAVGGEAGIGGAGGQAGSVDVGLEMEAHDRSALAQFIANLQDVVLMLRIEGGQREGGHPETDCRRAAGHQGLRCADEVPRGMPQSGRAELSS